MNLGYLTNSLVHHGMKDISEIANWSIQNGFQALEIGPNIPFDQLEEVIRERKIRVSALTYCRNYLSENEELAQHHRNELISRVKIAGELGIPTVITSTGICANVKRDYYDDYDVIRQKPVYSIERVVSFFDEVVELAERVNVKIAFENCPLMGNIAISPELWKMLFEKIDSRNVGLAYDPSHLIWQMIDPYLPIKEFANHILHVHAKDTEINQERLKRLGILTDYSWWRYRLPGLGDLDWSKFLSELNNIGFTGEISIEHEDPVWGGNLNKTKQGLLRSKEFLEKVNLTQKNQ